MALESAAFFHARLTKLELSGYKDDFGRLGWNTMAVSSLWRLVLTETSHKKQQPGKQLVSKGHSNRDRDSTTRLYYSS
jgi:hypothetical protein